MLQSGVRTSGALFGGRCSGSFILNGQLPVAILLSKHWWGYGLCWYGVCSPCSHSAVWYRSMVTTAPDRGTSWATFWRSSPRCRMRWSPVEFFFFTFCCLTLLKTNFPATLQSLTLPLCSTGREGGRSLAQPADETRAAAAASSVPRHLDPVSQPADHDPVPAQWLRTGALQHARVLLHLLVRLHRRVLRALWLVLFPVKAHKSCLLTF